MRPNAIMLSFKFRRYVFYVLAVTLCLSLFYDTLRSSKLEHKTNRGIGRSNSNGAAETFSATVNVSHHHDNAALLQSERVQTDIHGTQHSRAVITTDQSDGSLYDLNNVTETQAAGDGGEKRRPEENDVKAMNAGEQENEPRETWRVDIPEYFSKSIPFGPKACKWMKRIGWRPTLDQQNYGYVINPADKSDWSHNRAWNESESQMRNTTLLILVCSGLANIERREIIRKTWLGWSIEKKLPTITLFLLGSSPDQALMDAVRRESETHGDIIQEDFMDTYYNLTLKTIMAIKWAATYCKDADYVMKTNDDGVLNIEALVRDMSSAPAEFRRDYLAGVRLTDTLVIRKPYSTWCIPRSIYSADKYHTYPRGAGYVFSIDVATKLYDASRDMFPFPFEDVYMGTLIQKIGITIRNRNSLEIFTQAFNLEPFVKTEASLLALRKGHLIWNVSPKTAVDLWNATISNKWPRLEGRSKCDMKCVQEAEYLP